jgi:hypothetical protein
MVTLPGRKECKVDLSASWGINGDLCSTDRLSSKGHNYGMSESMICPPLYGSREVGEHSKVYRPLIGTPGRRRSGYRCGRGHIFFVVSDPKRISQPILSGEQLHPG